MPIQNYGVLKGRAIERRLGSGGSPHYQVKLIDESTEYRIAINVQSQDGSEVLFLIKSNFTHPICEDLKLLPLGFSEQPSQPGGLAVDYIRGNIAQPWEFKALPINVPGPDNDLNEKLDHYVQRAMADEEAMVYAFGQRWGPEPSKRDRYFGFLPGNGIHDIHMNQGNDPGHSGDDGVWQDGGLLFHFPAQQQWVGVFLKFQSQAWHTDDQTGHAEEFVPGGPPADHDEALRSPGFVPAVPQPELSLPDGLVRIVAAVVNDTHSPEQETVTILNTSPRPIDLSGWRIADKTKKKMPLNGPIAAGATLTIAIVAPVVLSNKGGIISLINADGLKVHGVSYTKTQASHPGWTIAF